MSVATKFVKSQLIESKRFRAKPLFMFLLIIVMLNACVSRTEKVHKHSLVNIANQISFPLLSPASYGGSLSITQLAEISVNGKTHELLFQVEISSTRIIIVGLLTSGTRVFTISYDGVLIKSDGINSVLEQIKPEYLMADLQLSFWPLSAIENAGFCESTEFTLEHCQIVQEIDTAGNTVRRIIQNSKTLIKIISVNNIEGDANQPEKIRRIKYINFTRNYKILLTTID